MLILIFGFLPSESCPYASELLLLRSSFSSDEFGLNLYFKNLRFAFYFRSDSRLILKSWLVWLFWLKSLSFLSICEGSIKNSLVVDGFPSRWVESPLLDWMTGIYVAEIWESLPSGMEVLSRLCDFWIGGRSWFLSFLRRLIVLVDNYEERDETVFYYYYFWQNRFYKLKSHINIGFI